MASGIDGQKITDGNLEIKISSLNKKILQKGKRHFRKIMII